MDARRYLTLRRRTYEVLDAAIPGDWLSAAVRRLLVFLIALSVLTVVLETEHGLAERYATLFLLLEAFAAIIFSAEYGARLWASVEHPRLRAMPRWRARLAYAATPGAIIDLIAVLPFLLFLLVPDDLRVLMIVRLARFFKLARYSPGLRSLLDAVVRERRALGACLIIILGVMLVTAALMHVVEGRAQPDKFGTIPDAMWWAIVTLTTVGYGDAVPITALGKVVAGITALLGLMMLALPVGIIATSFSEMIHNRDFVVTWGMVARVPLFVDLKAGEIAEIMRYLRSRTARAGEVITRRGDPADCMFFIAGGLVDVELPRRRVTMGDGQFFGERAIIRRARRSATVRAIQDTQLLILSADDVHALIELYPAIGRVIRAAALERLGENREFGPAGDFDSAELASPELAAPAERNR